MNLLVTFIILNILNVIIQTVKSICTIKCGKTIAAIANGVAYGFYTIVVVYMLCELPLLQKAFIVMICNLIGVYIVKAVEEKCQKDKLWKVEATLPADSDWAECVQYLRLQKIPTVYLDANKYIIINAYCATQQDSRATKQILDRFNAKYFVSENKTL